VHSRIHSNCVGLARMDKIVITDIVSRDIRFHTSKGKHGSDAMSPDPEYSCVYVTIETTDPKLTGTALAFSIGRGNEIIQMACHVLKHKVVGLALADIASGTGFRDLWRSMCYGQQLKWCGPEKGPVHQASAAIVNALWDMWAKREGVPVWQLVSEMDPELLVSCLDFRQVTDVITPEEAIQLIKDLRAKGHAARIAKMKGEGFPAYTTATGWLGYTDEQVKQKVVAALAEGFNSFKMKVGVSLEDDAKRAQVMRGAIGPDRNLMMDANAVWEVDEAITNMRALAKFNPYWIEEPLHPDDILGHARLQKAMDQFPKGKDGIPGNLSINVATGEQCSNRIMHKQFLQADGYRILQADVVRLGGLSEYLIVGLMAAKMKVKVCLHAGGVGLCNYAAHVCILDYINLSGTTEGKVTEYIDHLQEHFVHDLVVKRGKYIAPKDAGFGMEIKDESLAEYEYPFGRYWTKEYPNHFYKSKNGVHLPPPALPGRIAAGAYEGACVDQKAAAVPLKAKPSCCTAPMVAPATATITSPPPATTGAEKPSCAEGRSSPKAAKQILSAVALIVMGFFLAQLYEKSKKK